MGILIYSRLAYQAGPHECLYGGPTSCYRRVGCGLIGLLLGLWAFSDSFFLWLPNSSRRHHACSELLSPNYAELLGRVHCGNMLRFTHSHRTSKPKDALSSLGIAIACWALFMKKGI